MPESLTPMTDRKALAQAWRDPGSLATTLLIAYLDMMGDPSATSQDEDDDPLRWAPETIRHELQDRLGFVPEPLLFDRLMAAIQIATSDVFYRECASFISLCNVLSGSAFSPDIFDPADAGECAWGITEALLLAPPAPDDDEPFSPEIVAYIGHVLKEEGIRHPPDVLRIGLDPSSTGPPPVPAGYTDDPTFFAAVDSMERERSDGITSLLRENLTTLFTQVERLPLVRGRASEVAKRLAAMIEG